MSFRFVDIHDQAAALRRGDITAAALVEEHLVAGERLDTTLGTFIVRFPEQARQAAAVADAELAGGIDRGPLHGIPIGIKDILATVERPATAQSQVLDPAWGLGRDAPVVARLRAAGAVVVGKTTTMEYAIGYPDRRLHRWDPTDPGEAAKPFPLPRNPWNTDHWTGGSSSGTGNGVAAGLMAAGLGTDTAGSIRLPAGYCGVTGHKPTFGLVPKNGCVPLGFTYDHIGPLARSARDCATLLDVLAGPDAGDPTSRPAPRGPGRTYVQGLDRGLHGVRIGIARPVGVGEGLAVGVAERFDDACAALQVAGATLQEVEIPLWRELSEGCFLGLFAEAFAYHRADLAARWDRYGLDTRLGIASGALISGGDYVQIQRVRELGRRWAEDTFQGLDLLATPTTGMPAPAFENGPTRELRLRSLFTPAWNSLGLPSLALPMGFTLPDGSAVAAAGSGNLPVSLQLAGAWMTDALVLAAGAAYQEATAWHLEHPSLATQ